MNCYGCIHIKRKDGEHDTITYGCRLLPGEITGEVGPHQEMEPEACDNYEEK